MKTKETLFLLLCFILSTEAFSQKGPEWLKDAVIYHIYPSSFQDSDGNGIGDLKGIHSRLDYIRSIGVNTIWLSPIFSSEFKDGGYDITDFYRIDPRFGQNETLTALIQTAHSKGIRVCLDLVAGHTSISIHGFYSPSRLIPTCNIVITTFGQPTKNKNPKST